ncbi:MAG: paraquat-inducible protein A [Candidatus Accumulibacter sp.]|jgi:paraquat-inducible protein A|nr:paraquat-inducible protein A [Accumulibacter sp.]
MSGIIPRARQLGVVACHGCGLVCEDALDAAGGGGVRCPRCGATLRRRRPDGIARAWALLIAALILYVPANVLPVMYTELFGRGSDSTIMSGIIDFWRSGSHGIALVIFIASIAVPCTKFLVIGLLLTAISRRRDDRNLRERAGLYRLVERIGYWSMLDVAVVAIVSALVKFRALSDIEPRIGILFFGVVVILTMLSAMSFDPRLIWDSNGELCQESGIRDQDQDQESDGRVLREDAS